MDKSNQTEVDKNSRYLSLQANINRPSLMLLYEYFYAEYKANREESKRAVRSIVTELYDLHCSFKDFTSFPTTGKDFANKDNPNNLSHNSLNKFRNYLEKNAYILKVYSHINLPGCQKKAKYELTEKITSIFQHVVGKENSGKFLYNNEKIEIYNKFVRLINDAVPDIPPKKTLIVREGERGARVEVEDPFLESNEAKSISKAIEALNRDLYSNLQIRIEQCDEKQLQDVIDNIEKDSFRSVNPSKVYLQAKYLLKEEGKITGGRLYGHFVQNLPNFIRKYLRVIVEGKYYPVSYLDYSSIHIAILYNQKYKQTPQSDLYLLSCFNDQQNKKYRKVIKKMLNALINADCEMKAIKKVASEIDVEGIAKDNVEDFLKFIVGGLKKDHAEIEEHFGSGIGVDLQKIDAKVALGVTSIGYWVYGIPIIPIHDGFVFPRMTLNDCEFRSAEEVIRKLMEDEYYTVVGCKSPSITDEFCHANLL